MASQQHIVDYILDQIAGAGTVSARKMFGEYALYCDGKVVALVCDDQLFVKPIPEAQAYIGTPEEAPPYPGAKPHFLIPGDRWEDREWLTGLIKATADALPLPVKKTRPSKKLPKQS